MKEIIYILCASFLIASCKNTKPETIDYVIVSGKIENASVPSLKVKKNYKPVKEITLNKDGSFTDTLMLDTGAYDIQAGKYFFPVYIKEGHNININANATNFKNSLTVTGISAPETNFLILKSKEKEQFYGEAGQKFYALGEDAYKNKVASYKKSLIKKLDENPEFNKNFIELEKRDLNYYYIDMLLKHQRMHRYFAKDSLYTVSDSFLKETESLSYELEEDYKYSQTYQNLVRGHYQNIAKKASEKGEDYNITYLNALGTNKNDFIRNSLLIDVASGSITYVKDRTTYYNNFMKFSTNKEDKKVITDLYNNLQLTVPGKISPKFTNYENHKGGTTSLEDFKGKYVYIDVWATWCGPCLYEVPYLQEVEKQYHGKNIEFVSISVDADKDHDKWKQMVTDKKMGGVQLYADNSFDSDFAKDYIIKAIPKFILIDPEGKIVKSNAPRPSDKKLIDLLEELGV
ncbi:thiol-disulfide isomerase/thioredoxin [Cellulophaga sp. RHA19]|uniref:TlpA family protein disulfide reductase n=1 Tax=Cellulophaga sp. RHA19 TaxID=1798237 RepID=UPI000C2C5072|nr:TlpA disulfide reductase family protein [Cellulophaga sp. RHA19]PKB43692.1 thiol-disulfide isomerase/thioredoxin [Cellulophaga sp. RHA19]